MLMNVIKCNLAKLLLHLLVFLKGEVTKKGSYANIEPVFIYLESYIISLMHLSF